MIKAELFLGNDGGETWINHLLKWVCDQRICFEVCLTSNLQTMPGLSLADHAVKRMFEQSVGVTICTDNRLMSRCTTTSELRKAIDAFRLTPKQVRDLVVNGFKRSFYPGAYDERRAYVRKVTEFYDRLVNEHGTGVSP